MVLVRLVSASWLLLGVASSQVEVSALIVCVK
jgi:hypothetical protein